MIAHIEWAKRHCRSVTGDVRAKDLPRRCSIVLELHGLIRDVSGSSCHWIRGVICFSFICFYRTYCENTDNETVVEVVSISRSISVTDSTWLAALVITSRVKSEPAVVMLNTESESAVPPEVAEVWVMLSPDHLFNADP